MALAGKKKRGGNLGRITEHEYIFPGHKGKDNMGGMRKKGTRVAWEREKLDPLDSRFSGSEKR